MTVIHPRSDWAKRSFTRHTSLVPGQVKWVAIHWPGSEGRLDPNKTAAYLRGWQQFHMDVRGWTDIAYNEAVDQNGEVWILRGDYADGSVVNMGGKVYSILAVYGQGDTPSPAMLKTISERAHLHASRWNATIRGHRDFKQTDCPGDKVYEWMKKGMPLTDDPKPPTTPPDDPEEKPSKVTVNGKLDEPTIKLWQSVMGTVQDGKISEPKSQLVEAVQKKLNAAKARDWEGKALTVDGAGIWSNASGRQPSDGRTRTIWALQKYLGIKPDGYLSPVSDTIKELQKRLNSGKM